jgi:hypothetical protein
MLPPAAPAVSSRGLERAVVRQRHAGAVGMVLPFRRRAAFAPASGVIPRDSALLLL